MSERRPLAATCEAVYRAALARMHPARLVADALAAGAVPDGPVRVLALGKAAHTMAAAAVAALGPRARDVLVVVPQGTPAPAIAAEVIHGAHPRPDAGSIAAGEALLAWSGRGGGAPALVLLSGGGSALAVAPADGVTLAEKADAVGALMRAGHTIHQLNTVRKHLSRTKGGRLGARLAPAPVAVLVLVLSDVPGDDLSVIASGPFAPDPSTFADAIRLVETPGVSVAPAVRAHLEAGARGEREETPKPGDLRLARVTHRVLAGPVDLARAAAEEARARGLEASHDPAPLVGDVADACARLVAWARAHAGGGPRLLAIGGEPTVRFSGAAAPDGGRAQHLALLCAGALDGLPAAVLVAGSDGRDGPTEQAGAVVDGGTGGDARRAGVGLEEALREARSGPAVVRLGAAIPRFDTGTHVCDLMIVAVE